LRPTGRCIDCVCGLRGFRFRMDPHPTAVFRDRLGLLSGSRPGRIERVMPIGLPRPRGLEARRAREFIDAAETITSIFLERGVLSGKIGGPSDGRTATPTPGESP